LFNQKGIIKKEMERKSLRIPDDDDDNDIDQIIPIEVPTSPTDTLLSPCSQKLLRKNSGSNKNNNNNNGLLSLSRRNSKMTYSLQVERDTKPPTLRNIILGTSSKNRQKIISLLGWPVSILIPDIDEKLIRTDDPYTLPLEIAKAKSFEVIKKIKNSRDLNDKDIIIITADQIAYFNNEIREKPRDEEEAKQFLSTLSRNHIATISAIVITHYPTGKQRSQVDVSKIYWNEITNNVIDKVISKGMIYQAAGGFRIDDDDLNPLIVSIEGSVSCIMGLNIDTLKKLINDLDHDIDYDIDNNNNNNNNNNNDNNDNNNNNNINNNECKK
jgi:septum formation protein